ncbi:MAG: ABC transporter family substrate-binding protein [Acidimicrobiia bacterium]
MRPTRRMLGLLLAIALVTGACGGGDGGGGDDNATDDTGGNADSATSNEINTVDVADLPQGGTLTWALSGFPPNFNYHNLDGPEADNADVIGALMPGTFEYDAKAEPSLDEEYVTKVELTSESPQVITYQINPKAKWDDGTPITWKDFEAQWKALNGTNDAFKVASTQGYDKMESVVRGKDDLEVIVTFKEPFADWRGEFNPLYPAATNTDPAVFNDGWREKFLTTAGPFKVEGIDKTAQTITLVRNEKWWGRPAKLDRIIYRVIDPDAQVGALANGEIDFFDVGPDVNKLKRAEQMAGVELRKAAGPNFRHITINGQSEILKDVKVRKALALAINRETIAKAMLTPLGFEAKPLNNHIFMTNQEGYQSNAGDLEEVDTEAAGKLLDEAGWTQSGDVRMKDGKPLKIRFVIPTNVATSAQESQLVQQMLKAIGVQVDIAAVPLDDFFEKHINPGNFEFTVFSWLGTVFPISSSKSIYAKPKPGPDGGLVIQQNFARVGSDELDALFDKATRIFDAEEAAKVGNRIDKMIWDEVHSLTLYQRPEIIAAKATLANFGAFGFATAIYEDIGFTR